MRYLGAIHIHTKYSDGSGDINEVVRAAKLEGLDWIIVTDHNCMEVKEGFYDGICVITGEEISPAEANHYVALGIKEVIEPDNPNLYVQKVRELGGFGFAAHPDEAETRKNGFRPLRWLDKNLIPDGVEIWNHLSQWADYLDDTNIFSLAYAYLFKNRLIKKPYAKTLEWWDKLNNETDKIVPAIAGSDAHALKRKKFGIPLTIFPYKTVFKSLCNVIELDENLSEDFEIAKSQILIALKCGKNLILNRNNGKKIPEIKVADKELCVDAGKKAEIKIIFNGKETFKTVGKKCKFLLEKSGKYRVEILVNGRGFAYSNPIEVQYEQ